MFIAKRVHISILSQVQLSLSMLYFLIVKPPNGFDKVKVCSRNLLTGESIKRRLQHRCFSVNFVKFLRAGLV